MENNQGCNIRLLQIRPAAFSPYLHAGCQFESYTVVNELQGLYKLCATVADKRCGCVGGPSPAVTGGSEGEVAGAESMLHVPT